eukprot:2752915-Lingulodinium_polyedra.AAC.1
MSRAPGAPMARIFLERDLASRAIRHRTTFLHTRRPHSMGQRCSSPPSPRGGADGNAEPAAGP